MAAEPEGKPKAKVTLLTNFLGAFDVFRGGGTAVSVEAPKPARPAVAERIARYISPLAGLGIAFYWLGKAVGNEWPALRWARLDGWTGFVLVMSLIFVSIFGSLLPGRLARRSLNRVRRAGYRLCTECHYTLDGLGDTCDCPECGAKFDLEKAKVAWELRVPRMTIPKPTYRE
jgi:hypothetical protein